MILEDVHFRCQVSSDLLVLVSLELCIFLHKKLFNIFQLPKRGGSGPSLLVEGVRNKPYVHGYSAQFREEILFIVWIFSTNPMHTLCIYMHSCALKLFKAT